VGPIHFQLSCRQIPGPLASPFAAWPPLATHDSSGDPSPVLLPSTTCTLHDEFGDRDSLLLRKGAAPLPSIGGHSTRRTEASPVCAKHFYSSAAPFSSTLAPASSSGTRDDVHSTFNGVLGWHWFCSHHSFSLPAAALAVLRSAAVRSPVPNEQLLRPRSRSIGVGRLSTAPPPEKVLSSKMKRFTQRVGLLSSDAIAWHRSLAKNPVNRDILTTAPYSFPGRRTQISRARTRKRRMGRPRQTL
jgi:hypothetical protein